MREWTVDKSAYGPGPWQDEPDRLEWRHLGFPCLIVRSEATGSLCGYLALPPGHPWITAAEIDPRVHGGLTYGGRCQPTGPVCHVPAEGEPDDVYWIGFDCGHCWDLKPALDALLARIGAPAMDELRVYRDLAYVRGEVEGLARQAAHAGK